jgi:hypothetical protein
MKKLMNWWYATNKTMTRLCDDGEGNVYTNGELVVTYALGILVMFLVGIAG